MHVISRRVLRQFSELHPDAKAPLDAWFSEAKQATWKSPMDVKANFAMASILKNSRVVFNIGGNKYRLVVRINYQGGRIFIRYIGTHREYNEINAEEI